MWKWLFLRFLREKFWYFLANQHLNHFCFLEKKMLKKNPITKRTKSQKKPPHFSFFWTDKFPGVPRGEKSGFPESPFPGEQKSPGNSPLYLVTFFSKKYIVTSSVDWSSEDLEKLRLCRNRAYYKVNSKRRQHLQASLSTYLQKEWFTYYPGTLGPNYKKNPL